jgi:hypothetical protein
VLEAGLHEECPVGRHRGFGHELETTGCKLVVAERGSGVLAVPFGARPNRVVAVSRIFATSSNPKGSISELEAYVFAASSVGRGSVILCIR